MKNMVYLVETQVSEWDFFRENLADFSLRCVDELEDVEADAKAVSVFVHSRVDEAFLQAHPGVKLVTTRSTGHDHIDRAECTRRGVTVCNVSSVDENTVAEHTFALILAVARRLQEVREANKQPHFRSPGTFEERRSESSEPVVSGCASFTSDSRSGCRCWRMILTAVR